MDMFKLLSIQGFIAYYLDYCSKTDKLQQKARKLKRNGEMVEAKAVRKELYDLIRELSFTEKQYSLMCTLSELQEALVAYPEGSQERMAVRIVLDKKQSMLKLLNDCLGL
jgi:hypothetical protein